ncbi:MAG: type I secretion system permease/ATPase, partial [Bilophila sp.]|nr:type I secretion system permease/ATPase [Bilophila sp.]
TLEIVKVLYRGADILILDEPTSNMDNASEQMIKNRLKAVMGNKTLVLITHRLSMLELVDRLIVMEGGRIIADGPKNEVLRRLREQPAPRTEQ